MKYLIFCDCEGTLLDNKNNVSNYTIEKVKELSKEHNLCLVTSTSYDEIIGVYNQLGLNTFLSCENSGVIINPNTNQTYNFLLETNFILDLFNFIDTNLISMFYKSFNNFYCYNYDDKYKVLLDTKDCIIHQDNFNNLDLKDATSLFVIVKPDFKLDDYCLKHNLLLDFFGKDKTIAIYKISSPKASKYENCLLLKTFYDYDKIISVGDSQNDLGMLSIADYPILMKNTSVRNSVYPLSDYNNVNDGAIKAIFKKIQH